MRFRILGMKAKKDVLWRVYIWALKAAPVLLCEKLALRSEDYETVAHWFRKRLIM